MSRIRTLMALALALLALAFAGCQRKDLLDPHDHHNLYIKAHFDSLALSQLLSHKSDGWSAPGEPRTTKFVIFEKTTQKVARTGSFKGLEGGVYLPEGIYDLLLYTSDFNEYDANFYRNMNQKETAETYTRQTSIDQGARTDVTEMYMVEPDPTFGVLKEEIVVFQGTEDNVVEVEFVQKSFKYYLTIRAIGLHNIHTAKMNISGMYTTAYLAHEDHRMNEAGTQTVEMDIHYDTDPDELIDNGYLYGEFWSFGPNQREDISNSITLYFINGDVIVMKLKDLTPQIKELKKGGEIIVEEFLEIKGPAGGFQPGVKDWNETDVELVS
jgi:hypothetical protein